MLLNKNKLLLFGIIALAIFFRFYNLQVTPPGLYPDEAMNGNNALETLHAGNWKVFYPENNGREGLFINIQAVFLKFFGLQEPWVLRLPSAFFGILTVLGIFFLTKELFKNHKKAEIIGLLAAFLLAVSFWHINFSRMGFRAIMSPFFAVWAIYFFLKALDGGYLKNKIINSIIGGIFFGLGFYSYIAFRAMPTLIIAVLVFYWFKNKELAARKNILVSAFYFTVIAVLVFLPLGLYFLNHPSDFFGRTSDVSVFSSAAPIKDLALNILKTAGMFNVSGDYNSRHNIAGNPELFWPVGILFLIGLFLAIKNIIKKLRSGPPETGDEILHFAFCILISWLVIAALPVVISNEGIPHALRSILMVPPVFILAALGGFEIYEWLIKKNLPKKLLIASCYLLFILLIFQSYKSYFIDWGKNQEVQGAFNANYVEIGRILNALPNSLPKYVLVETSGVLVRGIPMPTQTVMFITDTFLPEKQKEKNIHYILPAEKNEIPPNSFAVILN